MSASDSPQREFAHIRATTTGELFPIGKRLHDEYFDPGTVRYDEAAGTLEIPFRRIFHDGPCRTVKNRLIYWIDEVDVLRCCLRFSNVTAYVLDDRTNVGALSLNDFHYDAERGTITLKCCEDCDFSISVNGLQAEYREIEYRGKARITKGFFWDCSSGNVYE